MSELSEYKRIVVARLESLSPFLRGYALGDFEVQIEIPEEEDEFTELFVGIRLMVEDFQEMLHEREEAIEKLVQTENSLNEKMQELERFNRMASGREHRMIELKREVNTLAEVLGRTQPYDLSFVEDKA